MVIKFIGEAYKMVYSRKPAKACRRIVQITNVESAGHSGPAFYPTELKMVLPFTSYQTVAFCEDMTTKYHIIQLTH